MSVGEDGTRFAERILSIQKEVKKGAILIINNRLNEYIKQQKETLSEMEKQHLEALRTLVKVADHRGLYWPDHDGCPLFLEHGQKIEDFRDINVIIFNEEENTELNSEDRNYWRDLSAETTQWIEQKKNSQTTSNSGIINSTGQTIQVTNTKNLEIFREEKKVFKKGTDISKIRSHLQPMISWATRITIFDRYAISNHKKSNPGTVSGLRHFLQLMKDQSISSGKKWDKLRIISGAQTVDEREDQVNTLKQLIDEMEMKEFFSEEKENYNRIEVSFKGSKSTRYVVFGNHLRDIGYEFQHSGLCHLEYGKKSKQINHGSNDFRIIGPEDKQTIGSIMNEIEDIESRYVYPIKLFSL